MNQRLYNFLSRDAYWHITSEKGWQGICESGAIEPSGKRSSLWGGSGKTDFATGESYAFNCGYVSLFDFVSPSRQDVFDHWEYCRDMFIPFRTDKLFLIQLNREQLSPQIIPNHVGLSDRHPERYGLCIKHCEVWYPDVILLNSVTNVFLLPTLEAESEFYFVPVNVGRSK